MSAKKFSINYLFNRLLIFCGLLFSFSACAQPVLTVTITCDMCESENITIRILTWKTQEIIAEETLESCGPLSIEIPFSYMGESVYIEANCDEDSSGGLSIGDYMAASESFKIELTNNITVDISGKITASIAGEVSCDVDCSGLIRISAFDRLCGEEPPCSIIGTAKPFDLNEKSAYMLFLDDVPLGSEVYMGGFCDANFNTFLDEGEYFGNVVDEQGLIVPITIEEEMTEKDLDVCQVQFQP